MKKFQLSLKKKALLWIVIILLPVLITFILAYNYNRMYLKNRTLDTLTIIAEAYEGHVYQFLEMSKRRVQDFASDGFIRSQILRKMHGGKCSVDILSKYLIKNKMVLDKTINNINILSLKGQVVASTDTSEIGKDYSREPFYIKGKEAVDVVESPLMPCGLPGLEIYAPILTKDTGRLIGVIVNFILISELDKLLSGEYHKELGAISWGKGKGAWKTLDIYLVNRNKLMITKSIFVKDTVLKQVANTLPVEAALTSEKEMVGFYKGYMGTEVAGASMCIPSLKWVLLVEIDKDEVLTPVKSVLISALITAGIVVVMIVLLFIVFIKKMVRPIRIISDAANDIARGNLDIVIPVKTSDEIGMLCESFNSMSRDIKSRTTELIKSNACLTEAQKIAHIGNCEWDVTKNKLYGSDEAYRLFGLTQQKPDDTYETFLNCVHPEDREFVNKSRDDALNNKKPIDIEHRILLKDTTVRIAQKKCVPILNNAGEVIRMVGTVQDITERKQAEDALIERSRLASLGTDVGFALIQKNTLREILQLCAEDLVKNLNVSFARIWTLNKEENVLELQSSAGIYTHIDGPHSRVPVGMYKIGLIAKERKPYLTNKVIGDSRIHDQEWAKQMGLVAFAGYPLMIEDRIVGVMAMFARQPLIEFTLKALASVSDVIALGIERKYMEEQLRKLSSVIEQSSTMVVITDTSGNIQYVNPKFMQSTGYTLEEVIGKNSRILKSGKTSPEEYKRLWDTITSGGEWQGELYNRRKNGEYYWELAHISSLKNAEGAIINFIAFKDDITDIKQSEKEQGKLREQLYHAQKLESVGKLAGGVAHDFNNILTVMVGYGNLVKMDMKEEDPSRPYIDRILLSAEKAANLIQGLLAFSRKQISNPKPLNLNDIITHTEGLLRRLIREDIILKINLTGKDCVVMADSNQIEQVLMNLATNARDAMPEGGNLSIGTDVREIDNAFIRKHGFGEMGRYAVITASDTGLGMDEKTKEMVFEPFFTTKEVGKGTGLGLAIVYGIIKQHNGYIEVQSKIGKGTTFTIYLPMIESRVERKKSAIQTALRSGTETILVAEDDAVVRELTRLTLEGQGYEVIEAVDGADAIEKFMKNKERIQLLVLDVIMPKRNGKAVYDEIRKTNPDIKALFMSGYDKNIIQKKRILKEGLNYIQKPVSPSVLLRKIREALEK